MAKISVSRVDAVVVKVKNNAGLYWKPAFLVDKYKLSSCE